MKQTTNQAKNQAATPRKKRSNAKRAGQPSQNKRKSSAREVALEVLTHVEEEKSFSNLQLNRALEHHQLEKVEAGLATELVYGTIQRLITIDWILDRFVKQGVNKLDGWVRNLLRMSLYQLRYLDRIPEHAAVHEAVEIAKRRGHSGISGMVNGVLRNVVRQKNTIAFPDNLSDVKRISLTHSHPEWMVSRWIKHYGPETTEAICRINNQPPSISVRVNRLKLTREKLLEKMRAEGLKAEPSSLSPDGIVIEGGIGNIANTPWFKDGQCTIQDESSMLVGAFLSPKAGSKVLDSCAAPGGKTTHLAEIMGNEGEIIATDFHEHKMKLIEFNAKRLGAKIIHPVQADARNLQQKMDETFDYILVDAPCSGFGVIRRKPDLKWNKTANDLAEISEMQYEILTSAAALCKTGGTIVYSTCTMEPTENELLVERFLKEHPNFHLDTEAAHFLPESVRNQIEIEGKEGMLQILPSHFGTDGFFLARLVCERKNDYGRI